ncbi:GTPase Era [Urinicoccus massiliensis]|uniref:GTPase Era n=1 Tax=Urinicoccus massiliensis TaxID=1723382 RepID=A0A8H2M6M7_9FIRM|nr:[FeFe] hydrogenase H-cluster maturation GTPase HydF [Urinicoccus massiliensis]VFB16117.1 GTPase Era [Urinicoccus massiliensis]
MENRGNQKHIGIFGQANAGKSTLFNLLLGQDYSIVDPKAGTTTDPVYKAMEVQGLGPCVFIDTAGLYDASLLQEKRTQRALQVLDECDLCLVVLRQGMEDLSWLQDLRRRKKKILLVANGPLEKDLRDQVKEEVLPFKKDKILQALAGALKEDQEPGLLDGLAKKGDLLLLVMPQDIQAPKGRLILPQVMTLRAGLDLGCRLLTIQPQDLEKSLEDLGDKISLVVTDSQIFSQVKKKLPNSLRLTSFSVLMARMKGDIQAYLEGARKLDDLGGEARILISEACSHAPMEEDIGRVQIPRLLRERLGLDVKIDFARGLDYPDNLKDYDLVISCGSCMFNRAMTMARIHQAQEAGVAISNYGLVIAKIRGILDDIAY